MSYQFYTNQSEVNDYEDDMRLFEGILNAIIIIPTKKYIQ